MSTHSLVRLASLPLAIMAVALAATSAAGAKPSPEAARFDRFSHPDGSNYFALSLKPQRVAPVVGPRDVVLLFDTSASQVGPYRAEALAALKGTLASLSPNDRVRLVAVDVNAIPLTAGFAQPGSNETAEALKKLDRRTPLGASDMGKALTTAADSFKNGSKNPRAVIYIGEGTSRANLVGIEEFEKLVTRLADARIPVNSYVVGPRPDLQLLGALAGQTGGRMIEKSAQAGRDLAAAADATVLWPSAPVNWPAGFTVYPKRTPPLRSDRDTVVIGKYAGQGPFTIQMSAVDAAGARDLSWSIQPGASDEDSSYLAELVGQAALDGGISLPLRDSGSLEDAREALGMGVQSLAHLARQALASGNLDQAEQLAGEALRQDPGNLEVLAVKGALAKRRGGAQAPAADVPPAGEGPPAVTAGPVPAGGDGLNLIGAGPEPLAGGGALTRAFAEEERLIKTVIQTDVNSAINQARGLMDTDPERAGQDLKLALDKVSRTAELDPEVRGQLTNLIQGALREASRRTVEMEERRREQQETLAMAHERRLTADNLLRREQKIRQLLERFDSLMQEGQYVLAEEGAAAEARELDPDNPVPLLAALYSRAIGYDVESMALRQARQKGVVDTLAQAERAHIPFADEPPIIYPKAEVWQELSNRRIERYSSMTLAEPGDAEKKIEAALKSPTQLEFIETPLQDVIDYLKDFHKIEIQVDRKSLGDVGLDPSTLPITKNLKGISLRSALKLTLRDLDLTYVIEDEVLLITTPEEAETRLTTKVYPVADLVLPINNNSMGFGGMGMGMGMGVGMGGMGGMGMMGGMGGMGGGMGGMGGGMGGGMWNVPREILPRVPQGGFQAFSVEDDLKVSAKDPKAPTAESPAKIQLEIRPDADPEAVWEEYFSTHQPTPAAVRDAVRRLRGDTKLKQQVQFAHIVALIQAALRHGQPQPWMYEVLAVVMQAQGRPSEEIERVVMSAVDYADTPADLMYIGVYLARLGQGDTDRTLSSRALQIFRQVSRMQPLWPEPYMHGLKAAQRLDDLEGKQWATLGILSQAWTNDQEEVWKNGLHAANAVLERLQAEKRTEEAKQFRAALDKAVTRDCVAVVSWNGDADVDLLVEEPSGTVCSLRNPRSTAGGVMLGDTFSRLGQDSTQGYQEVYVCPKGFSGAYRVLLRRVWGKVTGGKVKVEVYAHYRSENQRCVRKWVSLQDGQAVVVFDLKDGRRTESLQQQQVANAAGAQLAVGRQILAQQLAAAADPKAAASLDASRQLQANNPGVVPIPFQFVGAVGYQPVIQTISEGASMSAVAVVSADRRYVRITPVPYFSGISEVNTFNFATGESGQSGGGTGGQGYGGMGFGGGGLGGFGGGGGGGGGGFF